MRMEIGEGTILLDGLRDQRPRFCDLRPYFCDQRPYFCDHWERLVNVEQETKDG